ncbi:MAG: secretin N-terminal domain-containing protein [Granulosicoccus sp.]
MMKPIQRLYPAATLMCVLVVVMEFAHSQSNTSEKFTLQLRNADIHSLIETVSERTGKNFIVDPRVKARVTVVSSEPIDSVELNELFLSVLDVHGFAEIPAGRLFKIVPLQTGVQSAVPVVGALPEPDAGLITRLIPLTHMSVVELVEVLRPLLPATANLGAEPSSNTLIITDSAANVERIIDLVHELGHSRSD